VSQLTIMLHSWEDHRYNCSNNTWQNYRYLFVD